MSPCFLPSLILHKSFQAAEVLAAEGLEACVVNAHTAKPLDTACIAAAARKCGAAVTAENHTVIGWLGGAICEEPAASWPVPVVRVGVPDRFGEVGKMAGLHRIMGWMSSILRRPQERRFL